MSAIGSVSLPSCPLCAGQPVLRALDPHLGFRVPLRRCDRCCGIWADSETVRVARLHYDGSHYVMTRGHGAQPCRRCDALIERASETCDQCLGDQRLPCGGCGGQMGIVSIAGVCIDVCWSCRAAWFDRGELGLIASAHAAELLARLGPGPAPQGQQGAGAVRATAVDVMGAAPDLALVGAHQAAELALQGAEVAAQHLAAAPELAAGAGHVALEAGAAGGGLAADAAAALLKLLAGLFSWL